MAKPVIFTVDDDPGVLRAIERDLRQHFGKDYRILRAESGQTALESLRLKARWWSPNREKSLSATPEDHRSKAVLVRSIDRDRRKSPAIPGCRWYLS